MMGGCGSAGKAHKYDTVCVTSFNFFFWPVKCIQTKKFDIKLHSSSSLVTTICRNSIFCCPLHPVLSLNPITDGIKN